MIDFHEFWKPHAIEQDQTLEVCVGSLHTWIHRGEKEWRCTPKKQI